MSDDEFLNSFKSYEKQFIAFIGDEDLSSLSKKEVMLVTYAFTLKQIRRDPVQIIHFHESNVQMGDIMSSEDRSVRVGGNVSGSQIITGDHNVAELTLTQLPDADTVDIAAALAELRAMLAALGGPDAAKVGRALDDADEEAARPEPDRAEVAGTVTRALDLAKKAGEFSEHLGKIKSLVTMVAGWVGAGVASAPLLAAVGLAS